MIIDLIKSYTQEQTTVASFSVGTFTLDCQLEESHESNLEVTENPMESGAVSSDHSYLAPKRYGVRGMVVSYEPFDFVGDVLGDKLTFTKSLPLPLGVGAIIDQAQAAVNRYAGQAIQLIEQAKPLAPWLPSSLGWLGDESKSANRYEKIYADLLSIQASGELLTVTSGLMTYNNMKLINVTASRGTDDAVELALTFKEVHIVETRTVSGLVVNVPTQVKVTTKPEGEKKTGRAADQAAKPKAKGKTSPTKQTKKSLINAGLDVVLGR